MQKILLSIVLLLPLCLFGQDYERAAGVRLGHSSGITYKKYVVKTEAVEMILSGRNEGTQFTALYEFHKPMEVSFEDESFFFYYGIGGHIGFERFDDLNKVLISNTPLEFVFEDKSYLAIGLDAIVGVEYRYLSVPMTIGFEVKPYFNFIGMRYTKSRFWDAGFSIKYIF
ncbi:MAG: hypothetical protein GY816_18830 [Cytophagales bacterium]|nr:hypothetical protein [Cytophagales bacterium]